MRIKNRVFKPSFPVTKLAKVGGGLGTLFELKSLLRFFQDTVNYEFQL